MKIGIKKKMFMTALMGGLMMIGMNGNTAAAASPNGNPFGLVYGKATEKNEPGKVNIRPVEYEVDGIKVAANLYLPADYDEKSDKKYAAITVAHPNGGSKEQVAGLYAQRLAELGYITVAADARYQGASGGTPRLRDYPSNRIEDVSGMVDYLSTLNKVDRARIAALGICGGGGYTLAAAQTDKRIKAVAVLSMFNSGRCAVMASMMPISQAFRLAFKKRLMPGKKNFPAISSMKASYRPMLPTTIFGPRWQNSRKTPSIVTASNTMA